MTERVKMNRKRHILLFSIFLIPLVTMLSIVSNTSKVSSKESANFLLRSIPEKCEIKINELVCYDNTLGNEDKSNITIKKSEKPPVSFNEKEIGVYNKNKTIILSEFIKNIDNAGCMLLPISDSGIESILPSRWFKPTVAYSIIMRCPNVLKKFDSVMDFSDVMLNKQVLKNEQCIRYSGKDTMVLAKESGFALAPNEEFFICKDNTETLLSRKEINKNEFLKQCYLDLIESKKDPLERCGKIYSLLDETRFINAKSKSIGAIVIENEKKSDYKEIPIESLVEIKK